MSPFPNKQTFLDPDQIALERLKSSVMRRLEAVRNGDRAPRRDLPFREIARATRIPWPSDSLINLLVQELRDAGWSVTVHTKGWDEDMIVIG